jgi:hypothetical protein
VGLGNQLPVPPKRTSSPGARRSLRPGTGSRPTRATTRTRTSSGSALDDIFASRATITFQYSEPPKSLAIDGRELPELALERAIAVDPGEHAVVASSENGGTFRGKVGVRAEEVGRTKFFSVRFARGGGPPEDEVGKGVQYPRRPGEEGMSVLQIVNVVATVTLATGIAVGGSYLLYGTENPRGFGSPEGVAVIVTELSLIAAGTVIAIVGD